MLLLKISFEFFDDLFFLKEDLFNLSSVLLSAILDSFQLQAQDLDLLLHGFGLLNFKIQLLYFLLLLVKVLLLKLYLSASLVFLIGEFLDSIFKFGVVLFLIGQLHLDLIDFFMIGIKL